MEKFSSVIQYCMDNIEKQKLTFDLVYELGPGAEKERKQWINSGIKTLDALLFNVTNILEMFAIYSGYDDSPSQFIYDLHSILGDYSYHASFYSIIYYSIDNMFDDTVSMTEIDDTISNIGVDDSTLCELVNSFGLHCNVSKKRNMLTDIQKYSFAIKNCLNCLSKGEPPSANNRDGARLRQIQYYSLKLHTIYFELGDCLLEVNSK